MSFLGGLSWVCKVQGSRITYSTLVLGFAYVLAGWGGATRTLSSLWVKHAVVLHRDRVTWAIVYRLGSRMNTCTVLSQSTLLQELGRKSCICLFPQAN
eukprot:2187698-Amphidinium_carterae.1